MVEYLHTVLSRPLADQVLQSGETRTFDTVSHIIVPITSANQHGSRYNPVPLHIRIVGLERTLAPFRTEYGIRISYVPVPHVNVTHDFSALILKHVAAELSEEVTPVSTMVWTSTDTLIAEFAALGFAVLPAEWDSEAKRYHREPPAAIIRKLVTAPWSNENVAYPLVSEATRTLWNDMPEIPRHIARLWNDPLLTDDGSLTESRNYGVYTVGMGNHDVLDLKFTDIKHAIKEGKIVDEGCADGALMVRLAQTFPDSDIIGIDITGEFVSRVEERQRAGDFGNSFVHVYQRNILEPIFADNSIDCVICNSTLHEVWSYGDGATSVRAYLAQKFAQLKPGGRLVIRDVVGPEDKEQTVYLKLHATDGIAASQSDEAIWKNTPTNELSTEARFYRFAHDFLHDMRESGRRGADTKLVYTVEERNGSRYIKLSLASAVEFLSRKDYHENWVSEMNEEFTFWDFTEWQNELRTVGFAIATDTAVPPQYSRAYQNEWIVKNRWEGTASLWVEGGGMFVPYPFPVTTMVLVGEKPLGQ
jgi:SAM-dependent methyltransferase